MTTYQISDTQIDELKRHIMLGGQSVYLRPASSNFRCTLQAAAWLFDSMHRNGEPNYCTSNGVTLVQYGLSPLQKALNMLSRIAWRSSPPNENRSSANMWDAILSIMEMASEKTDHIKVLTDEVGTMLEMQMNRLYELAMCYNFENPEEEERSILASFVHRIRSVTERTAL